MALIRLTKSVHRHTSEELLGVSLKGYVALTHLRGKEHLSQQALGEALHMDPNNLVLLLNDLEGDRLVERRRDPDDRRRHIVHLTPAGERALDRAEERMESIEGEVLGALSASERATLRELLGKALADAAVGDRAAAATGAAADGSG